MLPSKPSYLKDPPPKPAAAPKTVVTGLDVKQVMRVVLLLAVGVTLAVWVIGRTFTPGPVTRLEPRYVDAGPPAPPPKPEVRRAPPPPPPNPKPPVSSARPLSDNVPPPRVQAPPRPPGSVIPVAPIAPPTARSGTATPRGAQLPPPELRFETFEEVTDSAVYSARDADVEPPVVVYPQLLGRVPVGVRREDLAYVEVVINEQGMVSQVKATESPQTLDESMVLTMSLSAAKTWRFQPARKDGRAVKYRQVLPVSLR